MCVCVCVRVCVCTQMQLKQALGICRFPTRVLGDLTEPQCAAFGTLEMF